MSKRRGEKKRPVAGKQVTSMFDSDTFDAMNRFINEANMSSEVFSKTTKQSLILGLVRQHLIKTGHISQMPAYPLDD